METWSPEPGSASFTVLSAVLSIMSVPLCGELLKRGAGRVTLSLGVNRGSHQSIGLEGQLHGKIRKMYLETQKRVFSCSLCAGLRANPNRTINSAPQGTCHRCPLVPSVWRVMLNMPHENSWLALGMGAIHNLSTEVPSVRTEPRTLRSGDLIHSSRLLADGLVEELHPFMPFLSRGLLEPFLCRDPSQLSIQVQVC